MKLVTVVYFANGAFCSNSYSDDTRDLMGLVKYHGWPVEVIHRIELTAEEEGRLQHLPLRARVEAIREQMPECSLQQAMSAANSL